MVPPQISIAESPPQALPVDPDGILEALKRRTQWVNWKYAWDGKRWTKHPHNPRTGRMASSTDLMTWSPFEVVLEAYEAGMYNGIGFCFCSADPFVGLDFDNCRNPETGEVDSCVLEYVARFEDRYVEVSVSGTGIHLITRGKIQGGTNKGNYEIYDQDRFFTLTGVLL